MRYGCRRCGNPLPAVQAGETLRVRCSKHSCGFVNVIPADPNLAPWEARGAMKLLVVDDREGAVLLAPPAPRARTHKSLLTLCVLVTLLLVVVNPTLRQTIMIQYAVHEIATTNSAGTAQRWCQSLEGIGTPARSAAPVVWDLHHRIFKGGQALKESFINSVLDTIDPRFVSSRRPRLTRDSSTEDLITALQFPDAQIRRQAANLLGDAGANSRDAVEPLTALAARTQDGARLNAVVALGKIGPDASSAVPVLIKLLTASGTIRDAAMRALNEIAPQDSRVLIAIPVPLTQPGR
jgi:RNase P/RNase MRP subunit POP5